MIDRVEAQTVLDNLFGADGFSVAVHAWPDDGGSPLAIEVVAGEGACADCLVPKSTLRGILSKRLGLPDGAVVEVTYPANSPAHLG
jgi:hypothetical protein